MKRKREEEQKEWSKMRNLKRVLNAFPLIKEAVEVGDCRVIEYLLDMGADIDMTTSEVRNECYFPPYIDLCFSGY